MTLRVHSLPGCVGVAALSLLALAPAHGVLAAEHAASAFAGARPLADDELAALRGGFHTADGLEISFGYRVELDVEDGLQLTARFNPAARAGQSALGVSLGDGEGPLAGLELAGDGTVQVLAGAPKVTRGANGTRYEFSDEVIARLRDNGEGFTFSSGGEVPVNLEQAGNGLHLVVGDGTRTLVIDRLGPQGIDAKVANRLDGAGIDHQLFFDVDLLNFSELAPARQAAQTGRRLQNLINRGVVGSLTPR